MRKVIAIIWMVFIFIGTCSTGIKDIFLKGQIRFRLNPGPSWADIGMLYHNADFVFILQKIGHFTVYLILGLLLMNRAHRIKGLVIAIVYAIVTELLQPFFYRDPRILDMLVNFAGILLAYVIGITFDQRSKKF